MPLFQEDDPFTYLPLSTVQDKEEEGCPTFIPLFNSCARCLLAQLFLCFSLIHRTSGEYQLCVQPGGNLGMSRHRDALPDHGRSNGSLNCAPGAYRALMQSLVLRAPMQRWMHVHSFVVISFLLIVIVPSFDQLPATSCCPWLVRMNALDCLCCGCRVVL